MKDVFLKFYFSVAEAELAKNILEKHGIVAILQKRGAKYPGDMGDSYGADILVVDRDVVRAMKILGIEHD